VSIVAEFLVSHGRAAAISRCRDAGGLQPVRSDVVVIRGKRGLELGEILCPALPEAHEAASGELLRFASPADRQQSEQLYVRGRVILDDLQALVLSDGLPLQPLDVDLTLDGERADVNVLSWGQAPLTRLREELHARHGVAVFFLDCSRPAESGCGSCGADGCGDCGSGGCGDCGSGGCSRGPTSADELTRYFASLREQMNSAGRLSLV
jgi:hypothetical protein